MQIDSEHADVQEEVATIHLDNTLLSVGTHLQITDEEGAVLYDCLSHIGLLSPAWEIVHGGRQVAELRRGFSLTAKWNVFGSLGQFVIRQKLLSFTPQLTVCGGRFNGAVLSSDVLQRTYDLSRDGTCLAVATASVLSVTEHIAIELFAPSIELELLAVILMVATHVDRTLRASGDR